MNINYRCLREFENQGIFPNPEHQADFSELRTVTASILFQQRGL